MKHLLFGFIFLFTAATSALAQDASSAAQSQANDIHQALRFVAVFMHPHQSIPNYKNVASCSLGYYS
jgi:hypothetical protein